jgi:spoIIIJ-associated protein
MTNFEAEMSQERTNLEVIAPTVEEAVAKGLNQLGLPAEAVEVEVLDAGSRGLFGLGSRQARVKLTIKVREPQRVAEQPVRAVEYQPPAAAAPKAAAKEIVVEEAPVPVESTPAVQREEKTISGDEHTLQVARDTVNELLEKMKVKATVTARYISPESAGEEPQVLVDVQGDDLSILIGRRSETLNALQYIASLIVGKELEHWVPLSLDVQGYRARRDRQLRQLARRMADQALHTGRRQVLEPMPANERRVIHLELRDHAQVATESVGDEPNRKVTIFLKKQS